MLRQTTGIGDEPDVDTFLWAMRRVNQGGIDQLRAFVDITLLSAQRFGAVAQESSY